MVTAERNERQTIRRMTFVAVFGALSYLLTAFAKIPYFAGGYFNFGDVINFFVSIALGPLEGALVGILGGALGDLTTGYAIYAPWTILAKGLLGISSGLLYIVLKNKKIIRFSPLFVGAIFDVISYLPAYWILIKEGWFLNSLYDCIQAFGSAILVIPLYLLVEKTGILKSFKE